MLKFYSPNARKMLDILLKFSFENKKEVKLSILEKYLGWNMEKVIKIAKEITNIPELIYLNRERLKNKRIVKFNLKNDSILIEDYEL